MKTGLLCTSVLVVVVACSESGTSADMATCPASPPVSIDAGAAPSPKDMVYVDCTADWGVGGYSLLNVPKDLKSGFHPDAARCADWFCLPEDGEWKERPLCKIIHGAKGRQYVAVMAGEGRAAPPLKKFRMWLDNGNAVDLTGQWNLWYTFTRDVPADPDTPQPVFVSTESGVPTYFRWKRLHVDFATRQIVVGDCPGVPGECQLWD